MVCEGHHVEQATDREGKVRAAIVFELRSLNAVTEAIEAEQTVTDVPIEALRTRAFNASQIDAQSPVTSTKNVYQRSRDVRIYVLARARGSCEGCTTPAPFLRKDGSPYLEPHHLRRLSDGGPDHPAHVIALCPTCHRRVHAGIDGINYNSALTVLMAKIEPI
jgi:5-methylcytosine-specific restriction enzyme A